MSHTFFFAAYVYLPGTDYVDIRVFSYEAGEYVDSCHGLKQQIVAVHYGEVELAVGYRGRWGYEGIVAIL